MIGEFFNYGKQLQIQDMSLKLVHTHTPHTHTHTHTNTHTHTHTHDGTNGFSNAVENFSKLNTSSITDHYAIYCVYTGCL